MHVACNIINKNEVFCHHTQYYLASYYCNIKLIINIKQLYQLMLTILRRRSRIVK